MAVGEVTISAKDLGAVALAEFCPRCFWLKRRAGNKLPFQTFPGIFSSIDSYNKKIVHGYLDRHGAAPAWFTPLGSITGYQSPPHYSKFSIRDADTNIVLRGSPDAIFRLDTGHYLIADYKTARYTNTQDNLFPMYQAQLNAYALIGAQHGLTPLAGLALLYFEPQTADSDAHDGNVLPNGFAMGFALRIQPVEYDPARFILPLLARVRQVLNLTRPPSGKENCQDCTLLDGLVALLNN
ncbi:MAG: PD-(D/E)XK nuclease family protein [Anaerolineae bacterium]|nr:PD-(D/E)XK nuclease family protein [Anaerolineae bacterium]